MTERLITALDGVNDAYLAECQAAREKGAFVFGVSKNPSRFWEPFGYVAAIAVFLCFIIMLPGLLPRRFEGNETTETLPEVTDSSTDQTDSGGTETDPEKDETVWPRLEYVTITEYPTDAMHLAPIRCGYASVVLIDGEQDEYAFVSPQGEILRNMRYRYAGEFLNGEAWVMYEDGSEGKVMSDVPPEEWIDPFPPREDNPVVEGERFGMITIYEDGDELYGLREENGSRITEPIYSYIEPFAPGSICTYANIDAGGLHTPVMLYPDGHTLLLPEETGYAYWEDGRIYCIDIGEDADTMQQTVLDNAGKELLTRRYSMVLDCGNGYYAVIDDGKLGLLDYTTCQVVFEPSLPCDWSVDMNVCYGEGYLTVMKDGCLAFVRFTLESGEETECPHEYSLLIAKESTCTEKGIRQYYCELCQNDYTEVIPVKAHVFQKETCTACGAKQVAKGLEFALNDDGKSYYLKSAKKCYAKHIGIPATYKGLPVTAIGEEAFYYHSTLQTVSIPSGVTRIEKNAFCGCYELLEVTLPSGLVYMGERAFAYCTELSTIVIPDGVTAIERATFLGCGQLRTVVFPDNLQRIGDSAFSICDQLGEVILPNSVKTIEDYAFSRCVALKTFTFSEGVTEIPSYVLNECYELRQITLPPYVTSIGEKAFENCRELKSFVIPEMLTVLEYGVLSGCSTLTEIVIPPSVTEIKAAAFMGCRGITSLTIPSSVTKIGERAFSGCSKLSEITIHNTVKHIDSMAFAYCRSLREVFIPRGVILENEIFAYCSELDDIYCEAAIQPRAWNDDWAMTCYATIHWGSTRP